MTLPELSSQWLRELTEIEELDEADRDDLRRDVERLVGWMLGYTWIVFGLKAVTTAPECYECARLYYTGFGVGSGAVVGVGVAIWIDRGDHS